MKYSNKLLAEQTRRLLRACTTHASLDQHTPTHSVTTCPSSASPTHGVSTCLSSASSAHSITTCLSSASPQHQHNWCSSNQCPCAVKPCWMPTSNEAQVARAEHPPASPDTAGHGPATALSWVFALPNNQMLIQLLWKNTFCAFFCLVL